jgi:hypothetical protein
MMTTLACINIPLLSVSDTQTLIFQPGDDGPFWMTEEERELNHHDCIVPPCSGNTPKQNKTIVELKVQLGPLDILS